MIVTTTAQVEGHPILETKGQVFGVIVRSRGLGGNIVAGLRTILGGEIHEYTAMVRGRAPSGDRQDVQERDDDGANAVVRMMFDSSEMGQTMTEIVAYGTAVRHSERAVTLRTVIIAICAVLVVLAIVESRDRLGGAVLIACEAAIVLALIVFERSRYQPKVDRSSAHGSRRANASKIRPRARRLRCTRTRRPVSATTALGLARFGLRRGFLKDDRGASSARRAVAMRNNLG